MADSSDYRILDENMEFKLKEINDSVIAQLPAGIGSIVLLCEFGPKSNLFYMTSGIERSGMIELLKKFIEIIEKDTRALGPGNPTV